MISRKIYDFDFAQFPHCALGAKIFCEIGLFRQFDGPNLNKFHDKESNSKESLPSAATQGKIFRENNGSESQIFTNLNLQLYSLSDPIFNAVLSSYH